MSAQHAQLDFAIVGAQKAGTSALWSFLAQHPQVYAEGRKELHAFDDEEHDWSGEHEPEAVKERLAACPEGMVTGDATPCTMYWPNAFARLARHSPDVRVIVLLRDPVERAVSAWRMQTSWGHRSNIRIPFKTWLRHPVRSATHARKRRARYQESRPFSEAIRYDIHAGYPVHRNTSYVSRGFYAEQLRRITAHVDRSQVLVLKQTDLQADHHATLDRVTDHLNVERFATYPNAEQIRASQGPDPDLRPEDRELLQQVFDRPNRELEATWDIHFE